jgi:hypothetical protein
LEEELKVALNFLRRIAISIAKPVLHVTIILNSKEEVEIGPQPIIEE